jgi:hypothetical protein
MTRYIGANVVDGCYEFDIYDRPEAEMMRPDDFIDSLAGMSIEDGDIYTVFDISDTDAWDELLSNYHVEMLPSIRKGSLFDLMSSPDWQPDLDIVDILQ